MLKDIERRVLAAQQYQTGIAAGTSAGPFPNQLDRPKPVRGQGEIHAILERLDKELGRMHQLQAELTSSITPILADPHEGKDTEGDAESLAATPVGKTLQQFVERINRMNDSLELVVSLVRL